MSASPRSLFLTFDQLATEDLQASAGTVTLGQHYRQQEGWKSITNGQSVASLKDVRLVLVGDTQQQCLFSDAPMNVTNCSIHNGDTNLQSIFQPADSQNPFLWVHVVNIDTYCSDKVRTAIQTCRQNCSPETLLAVTSFQMHTEPIDHTFDVLASEHLMRVPGILQHPQFSEFHLQDVTSSHDLLHTLFLHAETEASSKQQQQSDPNVEHRWDLRQVVAEPSTFPERNLPLEFGKFKAMRTPNFLYVAEAEPKNGSQPTEGLYVKPQDHWNVHNVCREYTEMADTMRKQLGLN